MSVATPPIDEQSWEQHNAEAAQRAHAQATADLERAQAAQAAQDAARTAERAQQAQAQWDAAVAPHQQAQRAVSLTDQATTLFQQATAPLREAMSRPRTPFGTAPQAPAMPGGPSDEATALGRVYQDARAAGLDEEGARVAQAIARTEAGYGGAVGDQGVSAGTFQLNHAGGMGDAYARDQGISAQESIARLRADPHAANRWALGGYLGQAIREGQRQGLTGADLATYAQRYGQRSVSPERAGANYDALGTSPSVVAGAYPPSRGFQAPFGAAGAPSRAEAVGQFEQGLPDDEAASICGPVAALAFAQANGRNPDLGEARRLAQQVGWTEAGGMNGVANEQALLQRMGVASRLDTNPDFGEIAHDAASGNPVIVSTGRHYYYVNGYNPETGQLRVGKTGEARRGGSAWMSAQQIADLDGGINGVLYVDSPRSPTPSVAVVDADAAGAGTGSYRGAAASSATGIRVAPATPDTSGERPPSEFEPPSRYAGERYLGPAVERAPAPEDVGMPAPILPATTPRTPEEWVRQQAASTAEERAAEARRLVEAGRRGEVPAPTDEEGLSYLALTGEPLANVGGRVAGAVAGEVGRRVLPAVTSNFRTSLGTYADRLYHETDAGNAERFLPVAGKFASPATLDHTYLATSPDLALGQGGRTGVRLEFDAAPIQGQINTAKPAWEPLWAQGDAEFVARLNEDSAYERALRSVTVGPQVAGARGDRVRLRSRLRELEDEGWTRTTNPDGSTTLTRPDVAAPPAPPAEAGQPGLLGRIGEALGELGRAGPASERLGVAAGGEALPPFPRPEDIGPQGPAGALGVAARDLLGQLGRLGPPRLANVAGAVAGGVGGYATTPEGASPQETIERTAAGALLGGTGVDVARGALRGGLPGAVRGLAGEGGVAERLGVATGEGGLLDAQGRPIRPPAGDVAPILDELGNVVKEVRVRAPREAIPRPEFLQPEARLPSQQVGLLRQVVDRSRNVIGAMGDAGAELAQRVHAWREGAETDAAAYLQRMPTVDKLSKTEFTNLVDVLEGNATPGNPRIAQAATETKGVLDDLFTRAENAGVNVAERIGNYFPHTYTEAIVDRLRDTTKRAEAIRHLMDTGQVGSEEEAIDRLSRFATASRSRRHGALEMERLANLPGYEKTKEALYNHVLSASRRINEVAQFGRDDAIKDRLVTRMTAEGYQGDLANDLFKTIVGAKSYSQAAEDISRVARAWHAATRLGLSAISNATQSVNTASVAGVLRTLQAMPRAAWSPAEKAFAASTGVTLDSIIREVREGGGWSDRLPSKLMLGFNTVEGFNRRVAAIAGRDFARDMAEKAAGGSSSAGRALQRLGLDPDAVRKAGGVLTPEQEITAARNIVERTQFRVDPQDLPQWTSHPIGKMVAQFKTFSYNQSAFVKRELIDEARRGNVLPILRFAILAPLAQAAATETRNVISGREPEEDPGMRALQYALGPLGLVGDVSRTLFGINSKYVPIERRTAQFTGSLLGPTVGTLTEGLGAGLNALEGNLTPAARLALRQVPYAGGRLATTLTPYKSQEEPTPAAPARSRDSGRSSRDTSRSRSR